MDDKLKLVDDKLKEPNGQVTEAAPEGRGDIGKWSNQRDCRSWA